MCVRVCVLGEKERAKKGEVKRGTGCCWPGGREKKMGNVLKPSCRGSRLFGGLGCSISFYQNQTTCLSKNIPKKAANVRGNLSYPYSLGSDPNSIDKS